MLGEFDLLNPDETKATTLARNDSTHPKDYAFACRKNIIPRIS
jgi:hypothetical protein